MLIIIFTIFHGIFLFIPWTISVEFETWALFFLYLLCEDFLWFIVNPYFGIKKFCPECCSWHRNWLFSIPVDYWHLIACSLSCYALAKNFG
jgi:hypothetical protein